MQPWPGGGAIFLTQDGGFGIAVATDGEYIAASQYSSSIDFGMSPQVFVFERPSYTLVHAVPKTRAYNTNEKYGGFRGCRGLLLPVGLFRASSHGPQTARLSVGLRGWLLNSFSPLSRDPGWNSYGRALSIDYPAMAVGVPYGLTALEHYNPGHVEICRVGFGNMFLLAFQPGVGLVDFCRRCQFR